jgi:death-on-curing protein
VTRYLSLAEFWYLAERVTGINATTLIKISRVELADSALHAPQAGFGDTDFYPDVYDKAAVLACRIAWNHPLPDGNKRAAWACLVAVHRPQRRFMERRATRHRRRRRGNARRRSTRGRRDLARDLASRTDHLSNLSPDAAR